MSEKYHTCHNCGCGSIVATGIGEISECADRIAELKAENGRLKSEQADIKLLCSKLAENRLRQEDGYTIIDFLRLWHDQQKTRAERLEAALREIRDMDIGAMPESTDYARGYNDCRQQMGSLKRAILDKHKEKK